MDNQSPAIAPVIQPARPRRAIGILKIVGLMALGSLLTILLALLFVALFVGKPDSGQGLALPPASGKVDLTAMVSQEYANREVAHQLAVSPVSLLGVGTVGGAVLQFNPDSTVTVTAQIKALGRQVNVVIVDRITISGNQVDLILAQDPKLDSLDLPIGILRGVVGQVNISVAKQLNDLIVSIGKAQNCTTGKLIGRVPTLQTLSVDQGGLIAGFSIDITV